MKKKMYVTRRLSELQKSPGLLAEPPDGPNSGYLVIQDEESKTKIDPCFGWCQWNNAIRKLPFPQDKELIVRYARINFTYHLSLDPVFFIPVLNQPLSSNRYYAVVPDGKHKGEAFTCSREKDKITCCFCRFVKDVKPRPLDPHNIYQQFKISPEDPDFETGFFARSIASDGFPPHFLRRGRWKIRTDTTKNFKLGIAQGLNSKLRARLPAFDFSLSQKSSVPFAVGKWYCPFIFVKEWTLSDQVTRSMYYELMLEQRWEKVFTCHNNTNDTGVAMDAILENEEVFVSGSKAEWNEKIAVDGVIWYTSYGPRGSKMSVGLRVEVVERMKREQERGGWVGGDERRVKINKVEEFKEGGKWTEFGCYVLVERFNLKRMDGSLVMSYDFKHFHQMKSKWDRLMLSIASL